jgi:hypothetical protein
MPRTVSGRTTKIWRDGRLVNWKDATIHVMSHLVHYGSSVFEGLRRYATPDGPSVFRVVDRIPVASAGLGEVTRAVQREYLEYCQGRAARAIRVAHAGTGRQRGYGSGR